MLLFARTNGLLEHKTIEDLNQLLRELGEEPGDDTAPDTADDWMIELAVTQARLTDIVQEILRLRNGRELRLGLVLSAWDTQLEQDLAPREWAERNLPLLVQTLDNESTIEWEVFGVSAQGGDFEGPERARLEKLDVIDRPIVHRSDGEEVGIAAPLRWALEP